VIESGVWKGQGTWLIENTLPDANVFSIDIALNLRQYISKKVKYFDQDFKLIDWSMIDNKEQTVIFFDDHQNALQRLIDAKKLGFRHFIFEDNYSAQHGDCYTLKKAFQHAGYKANYGVGFKAKIKELLYSGKVNIKPNSEDSDYLQQLLDVYYEFPPVFKKDKTRWGLKWDEENYSTPDPLYTEIEKEYLKIFENEATDYNWICYAKIK